MITKRRRSFNRGEGASVTLHHPRSVIDRAEHGGTISGVGDEARRQLLTREAEKAGSGRLGVVLLEGLSDNGFNIRG